jgi:hypothetical protein
MTFDDDANFLRGRLAPADPAVPTTPSDVEAARRKLAARLSPASIDGAAATSDGPISLGVNAAAARAADALHVDGPGYGQQLAVAGSPATGPRGRHTGSQGRRSRRRLWRVAAPFAAAAALLTGVLVVQPFSDSTPAGAAAMLAAANATEQAGSAQVSLVVRADGVTGIGDAAAAPGAGDQSITVDGAGTFDGGEARLVAHLPAPLGDVQLLSNANDVYVSAPPQLASLTGDKPWIHVSRGTLEQLAASAGNGSGVEALGASVAFDPTAALAYLRSVSQDVQVVGQETVRGVETTHYHGTISPSRLAAQLPEGSQRDAVGRAAAAANQDLPVDVWIDGQGRLAKLTISVDLGRLDVTGPQGTATNGTLPASGQSGSTHPTGVATADLEVWDYGAQVDTTPPPADQVTDLTSLLPMLGQLTGHR